MRVDKLSCSLRAMLKDPRFLGNRENFRFSDSLSTQAEHCRQVAFLAPPEEMMHFLGGWGLWKNDHDINEALAFRAFDIVVASIPINPEILARLTDLCFVQQIEDLSAEVRLIQPVGATSSNGKTRTMLQESKNLLINTQKLPEDFRSHMGEGIRIAVIDTGIDQHPDFMDRIVSSENVSDAQDEFDRVGHGTHVAGIISSSSDKYSGMAPCTELVSVKALNDSGVGTTSSVLRALAIAHQKGAHIVNLSLGLSGTPSDGRSILSNAVDKLVDMDIAVVVSAGNSGPDECSVSVPADAEGALTVGACSKQRELAEFSSRGPTLDGRMKRILLLPELEL